MSPFRITALSLTSVAIVICVIYLHGACGSGRLIKKEALMMGTVVSIKVPAGRSAAADINAAIDKAFDEIRRVEGVFSVYKDDSEISRINRLRAGEALKISDEAFELISVSADYAVRTGGAFDISVKPLVDLWAASRSAGSIPAKEDVDRALEKVGSKNILLDRAASTIAFAKDGMAIDLGGVAKGYAVDRAIRVLEENGIRNAIVDAGGDIYCLGMRSGKDEWKIGIRDPRRRNRIFLELRLKDKAIDTSGDYEKYYVVDGKRYSHIIDPRTGYAIGDDMVSASVIAADAATADILATALCVLGRPGLKNLDALEGHDAAVAYKDGDGLNTETTEAFTGRYNARKKS